MTCPSPRVQSRAASSCSRRHLHLRLFPPPGPLRLPDAQPCANRPVSAALCARAPASAPPQQLLHRHCRRRSGPSSFRRQLVLRRLRRLLCGGEHLVKRGVRCERIVMLCWNVAPGRSSATRRRARLGNHGVVHALRNRLARAAKGARFATLASTPRPLARAQSRPAGRRSPA